MKVTFYKEVGCLVFLRTQWTDDQPCTAEHGVHSAQVEVGMLTAVIEDTDLDSVSANYTSGWPMVCQQCRKPGPSTASRDVVLERLYADHKGRQKRRESFTAGDVFIDKQHLGSEACSAGWTNCDGQHLIVALPGNMRWDLQSRSAQCTKPDDHGHRCFVVQPYTRRRDRLTVNKEGDTCNAVSSFELPDGSSFYLQEDELLFVPAPIDL